MLILISFGTFCRVELEATALVRADIIAQGFAFFECGRDHISCTKRHDSPPKCILTNLSKK